MSKVTTMKDAITRLVRDGDTVAIEGFTHLICFAAGAFCYLGAAVPFLNQSDTARDEDSFNLLSFNQGGIFNHDEVCQILGMRKSLLRPMFDDDRGVWLFLANATLLFSHYVATRIQDMNEHILRRRHSDRRVEVGSDLNT